VSRHTLFQRPVLVTGASGFIGSHLVRRLVALGADVHAVARPGGHSRRFDDVRHSITEHAGDICDFESIARCYRGARPAVVFHLAADTTVRRFDDDWGAVERSLAVNLHGTLNVLRGSLESDSQVAAFVRVGGLEEYGAGETPYDESQREQPISPYSASQVSATHYCQVLQPRASTMIVTLRPALVYGPDQSSDFFIPSLIASCLSGAEYEMTEGTQGRDLLYVDDLVDALLLAATRPGLRGAVINVGHGEEHRIVDVAREIARLAGTESLLRIGVKPSRAGDLEHLAGRSDRAEALLGWRPRVGLHEGLRRTVDWYRRHFEEPLHEGGVAAAPGGSR